MKLDSEVKAKRDRKLEALWALQNQYNLGRWMARRAVYGDNLMTSGLTPARLRKARHG